MALGRKEKKVFNFVSFFQNNALALYCIFSAAFILFVSWVYITWVVHSSGYKSWYVVAYKEVVSNLYQSCDPSTITFWDMQVQVINFECVTSLPDTTVPEATVFDEDIFNQ